MQKYGNPEIDNPEKESDQNDRPDGSALIEKEFEKYPEIKAFEQALAQRTISQRSPQISGNEKVNGRSENRIADPEEEDHFSFFSRPLEPLAETL